MTPIFSEADSEFPNGQEQLKRNKDCEEFKKFVQDTSLYMINGFGSSIPEESEQRSPIYFEPYNIS